jgi:hypothetical protein
LTSSSVPRFDAQVVFLAPLAAAERGRAVVAGAV